MTGTAEYPKRLIEIDLPIKRISEHARREKSIRHGHISTLHIWWARRPLAACRAVICAALWPDPADLLCPEVFRQSARKQMQLWAGERLKLVSTESFNRFIEVQKTPSLLEDNLVLRRALLDFIADFANWDNSTKKEFLETSRALTQVAHEALGGVPGTRPLVVDSFAGGGAIPLEALRVGADAFASDLNPVAVLLNKVMLEYIPRYGQQLTNEVHKWGVWMKREAKKELAKFYPLDADGATPVAYLWARTIRCEGPGCGAEVPLLRSLWLANKAGRGVALQIIPNTEALCVDFDIIRQEKGVWSSTLNPNSSIKSPKLDGGTVKRGSATCPVCGYTTPVASVRRQLKERRGGAHDARLFCVVTTKMGAQGRDFRLPTETDANAVVRAKKILEKHLQQSVGHTSLIPDESTPPSNGHRAVSSVVIYGMTSWSDMFTKRQLLTLTTLVKLVHRVGDKIKSEHSTEFATAIQTVLGLAVSRLTDICNAFCRWEATKTQVRNLFGRQALPMLWDFAEPNVLADVAGNFSVTLETMIDALNKISVLNDIGHAEKASALHHPLPDDIAQAFITDPPYYDSVPYAELADFFYVWLKRAVGDLHTDLFKDVLTPKKEQAIVWNQHSDEQKREYERKMFHALFEGRRILNPAGIGLIVFAHKSTTGWESQLQAMIDAGWIVSGSWSIDTELGNRMNAMGTASLASSVHLICRPRETPDGSLQNRVGDWRDVLRELPTRIHEWMPRLTKDGVVGADAIFACLGPALEIFSRYSCVEKANGSKVNLKEYLEHVWAAVAKEAFNSIFKGADATGFEEDARLTAIWFWAMKEANGNGNQMPALELDDTEDAEDAERPASTDGKKTLQGYTMEYDAIRKLAQGLGVNLHNLSQPNGIITIKGNTAILNSVMNRAAYLLGRQLSFFEEHVERSGRKRQERLPVAQLKALKQRQGHIYDPQPALKFSPLDQPLFPELNQEDTRNLLERLLENGSTMLDRLHQSMLLFAHSHSTLLRSLLVETRFASDPQFWRLAQALLALYPKGSDEKRLVEGILARKKSLGL